jgi:NADPH:quinone reductase-like Zn-dependent oxidoreductase
MRAAILREYDATPGRVGFEPPRACAPPLPAEVLAAGLNPVDIRKAAGVFPLAPKPPVPSVAGWEGIVRMPDGSRAYFADPVAPFGAMAERTLVEPGATFPVPDGVDDGVAVALGIAGLAGWLAVEWSAKVREGESVLVLGASGTVGQVAVQAARLHGAGRVVAAARSADGLARAAELGADETVSLADGSDLAGALRSAAGGDGFDVIIDPLWGEPAAAAAKAAAPFCRLVALGQSAGTEATFTSADVRNNALRIVGHTNYKVPAEDRRAAYAHVCARAAAGELTADYQRVELDDAPAAWERLRSGPGAKLVVFP